MCSVEIFCRNRDDSVVVAIAKEIKGDSYHKTECMVTAVNEQAKEKNFVRYLLTASQKINLL